MKGSTKKGQRQLNGYLAKSDLKEASMTGFIIITDYIVQNWEHGKQKGVQQYFGSLSEIKMYLADGNGRLPEWRFIRSNERVPDSEKHGLTVEERRWKRTPLDANPQGTRVYE